MNVRSIRGPNCCDASVSATIMTEKTTPTTVMSDPASDDRISLAASGEPLITHDGSRSLPWKAASSMLKVAANSATAARLSIAGMSHKFVRSASSRQFDAIAGHRRVLRIVWSLSTFHADQSSRLTCDQDSVHGRAIHHSAPLTGKNGWRLLATRVTAR